MENYWSEFEYNKLKLLLNHRKVCSIMDVLNGRKSFDDKPPISVELHLTNQCNMKCSWCTDAALRSTPASLSLENIKGLFLYFAQHSVGVTIEGGGEPSIHPQFREIIEAGSSMGLHMGLISNGVLDIAALANYFRWVRISIDATNADEYLREKGVDCFARVMRNLEIMAKTRRVEDTHLGVGYVLTKRNISNFTKFIGRLDSMHVDYAYLRPVEEDAESAPTLNEMLQLKADILGMQEACRIKTMLVINERLIRDNDHLPCVAHSLTCVIQANGDVVLCEKRRQGAIVLGNVNKDSFENIWMSEAHAAIAKHLLNPENQAGCSECRITSFNRVFCDLNRIHTKNFI